MTKLQMKLWGRTFVIAACWCMTFAGVPLWFYENPPGWTLSIYMWAITFFLFPLFWPARWLKGALIIVQNFWVNGIVLIGMAVYPFFFVPGFFGGLSLAFAGICFIIAAIKKEKGESLENLKAGGAGPRE
eukprot:TRINITY_DN3796_c0_g1_i1.p1 TRINITY_DN3796_c0_g1~~TRINITY_DN3796_c0_g1_i1.p1  ORF type:complete len:130 (-),score=14.80 TRINITY_DN3796_c0_g1_i1:122-511(-)